MQKKIREYTTNADLTVRYDVARCIHAAECVSRLRAVFDPDKRPWIQPEHGAADHIADAIHHCPSGALQYERLDGKPGEPTPDRNTVQLVANGPYYVRGDIEVQNAQGEVVHTDTRLALCRCGQSKNKPFCDNTHIEAGFTHDALPDSSGFKMEDASGTPQKLIVQPATNGPLLLQGEVEIQNAEGVMVSRRTKPALCRCGNSNNKPFCDGTHRKIGFTAD